MLVHLVGAYKKMPLGRNKLIIYPQVPFHPSLLSSCKQQQQKKKRAGEFFSLSSSSSLESLKNHLTIWLIFIALFSFALALTLPVAVACLSFCFTSCFHHPYRELIKKLFFCVLLSSLLFCRLLLLFIYSFIFNRSIHVARLLFQLLRCLIRRLLLSFVLCCARLSVLWIHKQIKLFCLFSPFVLSFISFLKVLAAHKFLHYWL